jgi:hypothetical protein
LLRIMLNGVIDRCVGKLGGCSKISSHYFNLKMRVLKCECRINKVVR